MAKVTFTRCDKRIDHRAYGIYHSHEYARCDLARPVAELEAIACIMALAEWCGEVIVHDAALHVRLDYRAPYVLQERSLHQLLAIARRLLGGAMEALATQEIAVRPEPVFSPKRDHLYGRGASAGLRHGGELRMPDGDYGPGFAIDDTDEGAFGYFLTTSIYEGDVKILAAALLRLAAPEAGIGGIAAQSWGEIPVANPVGRLPDLGAACYRIAHGMKARVAAELEKLDWNGAPSNYTREDDDARDALLARVAAGLRIGRTLRDDASHNDPDCRFDYFTEDGEELPGEIVERLVAAEHLVPEDGIWGRSPVLEASDGITARDLNPRAHTVRFKAFETYCQHRRHDSDRECAHRCNRSDYCLEGSCPLVTQVYTADFGRSYARRFDDDPAFEAPDDWNHDPLVYAIHRNTERSYAWRAAGQDGVTVLVNTVLRSKFALGADHLVEESLAHHARQAVEDGHLVIVQEMPGLGMVVAPSPRLMADVEAMQAERARREQEAQATADA